MSTETSYENGRLVVTRVYDAPRERVFEAWVETSKVEKWWGCADTTDVKSEVEPRLGGKYVHTMTIKGETRPPLIATITEFDPPAILAYEGGGPNAGDVQTIRVEFTEHGSGTKVRLTHHNIPDQFSQYVIPGWTAAFGKLDQFLIDEARAA